jgi:bifunctional non-homologous end joining protein LigD
MDDPLEKRRVRLPALIEGTELKLSIELPGSAADVLAAVKAQGLEGVVAKRCGSVYQPGERSGDWLKVRVDKQQEFVVGGYRPDGATFDALLVGVYQGRDLHFVGKVKNGFVHHVRGELLKQLKPLQVDTCPLVICRTKRSRAGAPA